MWFRVALMLPLQLTFLVLVGYLCNLSKSIDQHINVFISAAQLVHSCKSAGACSRRSTEQWLWRVWCLEDCQVPSWNPFIIFGIYQCFWKFQTKFFTSTLFFTLHVYVHCQKKAVSVSWLWFHQGFSFQILVCLLGSPEWQNCVSCSLKMAQGWL